MRHTVHKSGTTRKGCQIGWTRQHQSNTKYLVYFFSLRGREKGIYEMAFSSCTKPLCHVGVPTAVSKSNSKSCLSPKREGSPKGLNLAQVSYPSRANEKLQPRFGDNTLKLQVC